MQGLLARPALAVDGRSRHGVGEAGGQRRVAGHVERLLARLAHAAGDHVVDQGRVEVVALHQRSQDVGQQVDGMPVLERAVAPAQRGADGVDDHRGGHGAHSAAPGPAGMPRYLYQPGGTQRAVAGSRDLRDWWMKAISPPPNSDMATEPKAAVSTIQTVASSWPWVRPVARLDDRAAVGGHRSGRQHLEGRPGRRAGLGEVGRRLVLGRPGGPPGRLLRGHDDVGAGPGLGDGELGGERPVPVGDRPRR